MEDESNIMKILVATDNHLGYKEKDSVLERDSFITFEEIFVIAKENNADFILLGGDLFHDNKPSRKSLHACMEIMRKHCLGSRPCQIEVVSDQAVDFGHTSRTITSVNYEDPNLNISMPVFSIHGNHDDPAGTGGLSAIDLLSVSGFLNHFGKISSLESIKISPVLLQKGATKLALYGLGSVRDERLHRLFTRKQVTFMRPKENTEEWFNLMVIHQNRAKHNQTNYIPEEFLDDFFDLVIWGHEHECRIEPEWNAIRSFFVVQPGSSVATSLSPGETKKKHIALLSISGKEMKVEKIPLKTVRNMYVEDIVLSQVPSIPAPNQAFTEEKIQAYCEERVESLLMKAETELSGHPKQPKKPLIRLRIDYSGGYPTFNPYRLGGKFSETVANADRIVQFLKKSVRSRFKNENFYMKGIDDLVGNEVVEKVKVEDLVQEFLTSTDKKYQMSLLSAKGMSLAVREYIEKQEKDAINHLCIHQLDIINNHLKRQATLQLDQANIVEEVARFKDTKKTGDNAGRGENEEEIRAVLARSRHNRVNNHDSIEMDDESISLDSDEPVLITSRRGHGIGSRGGRKRSGRGASTKGRGSRGKAASKSVVPVIETSRRSSRTVKDAFKNFSQCSTLPVDEITEILDSDEEGIQDISVTSRKGSVSESKSQKCKRGRGVNFSSDEDDNPFSRGLSKRKR